MGTITSNIGLVSGLDYGSMVEQLVAISARPRDLILERMGNLDAQRTAYLDISARVTALLARIQVLSGSSAFFDTSATSSLPDVLSATTTSDVQPGSYSFVVRALAARHQLVSRGFTDRTAPLSPGTLTIESAQARVNTTTRLEELNGHTGVQRGSFKIIDADGEEASISISDALTIGDVLDRINASGVGIQASVREDGLVLTDTSGGSGRVRVEEAGGGSTAADLGFGIGHTAQFDELVGTQVLYLGQSTPLSVLNDSLGIRTSAAGGDFDIKVGEADIAVDLSEIIKSTTRLQQLNHGQGVRLGEIKITSVDGTMAEVDLSAAETVGDVKQAIVAAFGDGRMSVVLSEGHLTISDSTDTDELPDGRAGDLIIEDISGHAARDLGIDGSAGDGKVRGRDVLHMDTLADLVSAINYAVGNEDDANDKQPIILASIRDDGHGIRLVNQSPAGGTIMLLGPQGSDSASHALQDLGFEEGTYYDPGGGAVVEGGRILGGIDTVLLKTLNGGAGITGSTIQIDAGGTSINVDLAAAETLGDVIGAISEAADSANLGIEVGYDSTGTRLVVSSSDGGLVTISDVGDGEFAQLTGLNQTAAMIRGDNLQRRYISENTRLEDLNAGRGVSAGQVKITSSTGAYATVDLSRSSVETIQDVIDAVDRLNLGVEARINDTGDGLVFVDTNGGANGLHIEEDGGTTGHDLNILGESVDGVIDGSFEFNLDIGGGDTLESFAARIGSETTLADATLLNDGTAMAPYRLSLSARVNGAAGELIIDDSATSLGMTTLTRAQDARVFYGESAESGILLTSSDNTFENVVDGLTFTAHSVSDSPVTVTIDRNLDNLVTTLGGLVDDYNAAMERIREASAYDEENEAPGILQGEGTLRMVQSRLSRMFTRAFDRVGGFSRLSQIGIKNEGGGRLSFDAEKFRSAYEADPAGVTEFFTDSADGIANVLQERIEAITDADGLIDHRTDALQSRKDLLQDRVDQLNDRLDRERARLLRDFQAMESALSQMQSQQASLADLASLADSYSLTSSGS